MHYFPLALVFIAGVILTIGDIILKEWVVKSYNTFYIAGLFLYFISMNLLAQSYKYEDIAVASVAMVIFNVVTLTIVGYFVFHENITVYEVSGIVLGIISITLLEFGKV
jgi:multidrug transporter EmrE-like cation transporter